MVQKGLLAKATSKKAKATAAASASAAPAKKVKMAVKSMSIPKKKSAKKEVPISYAQKEEEDEEDFDEEDDEDIGFDDVSDDDKDADDVFNEDINDDDDFEVKAEKHRRRMMAEGRLAAQEQQDDIRLRSVKPTPLHDMEEKAQDDIDMPKEQMRGLNQEHTNEELNDRVKEVLSVLSNFSQEREEGRSREEYLTILRSDLMSLFEYNDFLMDAILEMFPPQEAFEFLEAMERPRPTTIRTNTIKAKRRDLVQTLTKRGMNIEPLEKWSKVGLQIFESNVPIAGTVEYLAGHYMLQSAVSFLPVMALAPQENERVLDMSAAPGGKTTYIAQLMKNTGVLFANDVSEPRIKSLNANIQRLGVTNCVVTNYDGFGYEKIMRNFDRILLDAPCTGSGIISRDKSIKTSKQYEDIQRASQLQRRLLLSAIDACKVGGYVAYSTCSFLVEEDEAVVDYALRRRHVEVVEMGLPFGRPGFTKYRHARYHASIQESRRFFPHVHNMDGFYVCKLKKLRDGAVEGGEDEGDVKSATQTKKKVAPAVIPKSRNDAVEKAKAALLRGRFRAAAKSADVTSTSLKLSVPPPTAKGGKRPRDASSKPGKRASKGKRSE